MIEEILMGLGALLWIAGELYAVFTSGDTTTSYVRSFRRRWLWVRIVAVVFTVWLFAHFNLGMFG